MMYPRRVLRSFRWRATNGATAWKALLILGLLSSLGILPGQASAECVAPPSDLVNWWPGDGNADDVQGSINGILVGDTTFAAGQVGQAFSFDGNGDAVRLGDVSPNIFAGSDRKFTIDLWTQIDTLPAGVPGKTVGSTLIAKIGDSVVGPEDQREFAIVLRPDGSVDFSWASLDATGFRGVRAGTTLTLGVFHHIAVAYDASIDTNDGLDRVSTYIDGVLQTTFLSVSIGSLPDISDGSAQLSIGAAVASNLDNGYWVNGLIDEVKIFDRVLSALEVKAIFDAGSDGNCKPPTDPIDLIIALVAEVLGLNLQQGIENSFDSKLNAALRILDDLNQNNDVAAINTLDAFISEVQAQRGNKIPEAEADALIADAQEIIALLSGF